MAGDPSPDVPNGSTKRKARTPADVNAVTLLRGALEFRRRTGRSPTRSDIPAFHESVRGSLRNILSHDQVYNKLRHLRHKFCQPAANGHAPHDGILYELAADVWPADDEKKVKKEETTKMRAKNEEDEDEESKDAEMEEDGDHEDKEGQDGEGPRGGREFYPYLAHAASEHWKAHSLSNASLEVGLNLLNPSKAKALEQKWKKLLDDELKFQADWLKTCRDILALLNETHKGMSS